MPLLVGLCLAAALAACSTGPRSAPLDAALDDSTRDADAAGAPVERWRADTGRGIEIAPVRWGDSLLVAGTDRRLELRDLATGRRVWRKRLGGSLAGPPQMAQGYLVVTTAPPDGAVYLYRLDRKKPVWKQLIGDPAGGARLFENIVLAPTRDGKVIGLSPSDGRTVWVTNLATRVSGDPAFVPEQALLLVPGRGGELAAVDARGGERRWVTLLGEPLVSVAADTGRVVAAGLSGTFYGLKTLNGRLAWKVATAAPVGPPVSLAGEVALAATLDGQLLAWRREDGRPLWRRELGGPFRGAPAVAAGRGLVVAVSGQAFCFDVATGRVLGRARHPETVLAAPLAGLPDEWVVSGERGLVEVYRWPAE